MFLRNVFPASFLKDGCSLTLKMEAAGLLHTYLPDLTELHPSNHKEHTFKSVNSRNEDIQ